MAESKAWTGVLEGRGVIPDIEGGLKRERLLKGSDDQLDAAIRNIQKEMKGKK